MRKELQQFVSAAENLLSYQVTPEELTEEELGIIQYYLSIIGERFLANGATSTADASAAIAQPADPMTTPLGLS